MLNENEIILPKKIGMKINFSPPKNMAQDLLNLLLSNKKWPKTYGAVKSICFCCREIKQ